jgi:hypothetical protein
MQGANMFDTIRRYFDRGDTREAEMRKLRAEASQFKLPSETFIKLCKFLFFAGLAFLNFRLFNEIVPGLFGTATGIVAMLAEALAIYCHHYFSRASSWFRYALGGCGLALISFSITHATFSIFDLIGVYEYGADIQFYSRVVAFPLLAGLIGISVLVLSLTHPNNVIRMKESFLHTDVAIKRASAASQSQLMDTQTTLDNIHMEFLNERSRRDAAQVTTLANYIQTRNQITELLASIPDERLRAELAQGMGVSLESIRPAEEPKRAGFGAKLQARDPQGSDPGSVLD